MSKKKKKSRREKQEFPDLDVSYNLKARRDYMDNRFYVNGVKQKGKTVMQPLDKEAKKYLNDFNKEYYNASFGEGKAWDYDNIHKLQVDKETIDDLKTQIRALKKERKIIYLKSPNTTTEEDRELARMYNKQIEDIEEFIYKVHPRRECDDRNNARNADLLNMAKASNMYDLVSWEELDDEVISDKDIDAYKDYNYFDKRKDED